MISRRAILGAGLALPWVRFGNATADHIVVNARSTWGEDLPPVGPLEAEAPGDVRFLLVHHSAGENEYDAAEVPGILRGIYALHTGDRGWADVAYNFFVDRHGGAWEGRAGSLAAPIKGDATGGSQGFALLCCVLGTFTDQPPTAEALGSLSGLLAHLADTYGIDTDPAATTTFESRGSNRWPAGSVVTARTVSGHRDMSQTACPGNALYALIDDGTLARDAGARRATATTASTTTALPELGVTSAPVGAESATSSDADGADEQSRLVPALAAAALAAATGALVGLRLRRR
ncbi:MAG: N-acetylmuramoyl-L-alanine amidase [Acidimicrobiales bacterium]